MSIEANAAQGDESWPQLGYNTQNNSYAPNNTGPREKVTEQWAFQTGGMISESPAVVGDTLYIGSNDGNVYAIDTEDGNKKWSVETNGEVESSPTVVNDTVYVGSGDKLYALSTSEGEIKWTFETDGKVWASPTVHNDIVFTGGQAPTLYAVNTDDGSELWRYGTKSSWFGAPAVGGGNIYIISNYSGTIQAVDLASGNRQWQFKTGDRALTGVVYNMSDIFVATGSFLDDDGGAIYALNTETETKQWEYKEGEKNYSKPVVVKDRLLVRDNNSIFTLDISNGERQWKSEVPKNEVPARQAPVVVNETIYI